MTKKEPFLHVQKRNVDLFMALTAASVVAASERIDQKKDKIISSVPFLDKIRKKVDAFDKDMTQKHGKVYTKIRSSLHNTARTIAVFQLLGVPGLVGLCAYKTGEKVNSLLKPAYAAKKNGEAEGVLDYLMNHKKECSFTLTSASISIAATACRATGLQTVADACRVGKASLLALPEIDETFKSFKKWMKKEENFEEVKRNLAVLGITVATYFAGDKGVPMTRGATKTLDDNKNENKKKEEGKKPELSPEKKGQIGKILTALKQNTK